MRKSIRYIIAAAAAIFTAAVASARVVNSKTAKDNGDGTYTLTLESFATGKLDQTISTSRRPINAVLVLDVSGSMAEGFSNFIRACRFFELTFRFCAMGLPLIDNTPSNDESILHYLTWDGSIYRLYTVFCGIYKTSLILYIIIREY